MPHHNCSRDDTVLKSARAVLIVSILLYASALGLAPLVPGAIGLLFWIAIVSIIAMATSALACVLLQIQRLLRRRKAGVKRAG